MFNESSVVSSSNIEPGGIVGIRLGRIVGIQKTPSVSPIKFDLFTRDHEKMILHRVRISNTLLFLRGDDRIRWLNMRRVSLKMPSVPDNGVLLESTGTLSS